LYNAHDAATNNGRAITNKRVSINQNPFYIILKMYKIILYDCIIIIPYYNIKFKKLLRQTFSKRGLRKTLLGSGSLAIPQPLF